MFTLILLYLDYRRKHTACASGIATSLAPGTAPSNDVDARGDFAKAA